MSITTPSCNHGDASSPKSKSLLCQTRFHPAATGRRQQNLKVCLVKHDPILQTMGCDITTIIKCFVKHDSTLQPWGYDITMTLNVIAFSIRTKDYDDTQVIAFTIITSDITTTSNVIAFLNQNERLQRHSSHCFHDQNERFTTTFNVIAFTIRTIEYNDTKRRCFHDQNERLQRHSTSLLSQSERKVTMT